MNKWFYRFRTWFSAYSKCTVFSIVDANDVEPWIDEDIKMAYKAGYTQGIADEKFNRKANIIRRARNR